jgi:hypothetical protein
MPFDWWYLPDEQLYHTTITTEKGVSREWTFDARLFRKRW